MICVEQTASLPTHSQLMNNKHIIGHELLVGVSVHFMMCVMWDFTVLLFHNATTHITHTLHTQSQLITTHIMNTAQNTCWFLKNSIFKCWSLMRAQWIPVYSYATYVPSRYRRVAVITRIDIFYSYM